jgi:hypothetical protein
MSEDSGPLTEIAKVVPSVYYDLIARVSAGTPFLVTLLWPYRENYGELTWEKLLLLLGAGYIVGLLLTALSVLWLPVELLIMVVLRTPMKNWRRGLTRNDEIAVRSEQAGATLAKMQAEATLCQNLFSGFSLLVLLNHTNIVLELTPSNRTRGGLGKDVLPG